MTSVKQQKINIIKEMINTPYGKTIIGKDRDDLGKSLMSMDLEFLKKALVKFKKRKSVIVNGKSYTLHSMGGPLQKSKDPNFYKHLDKEKTNKSSGAILKSSPPLKRPKPLVKESKPVVKKPKTKDKEPRTIAQAKTMGKDYFIDKNNKKKAAVTAEELKKSGLSLRDYLNKKRGLKRKTKK
tara:strand:+ start:427 stop:972 length:546 start_codon:yes stop_codon:yes gene_type:complete